MNPIKRLVGHIYFFYALVLFIVTMLIVYIPVWIISFLPEPKCSKALHKAFRIWMGTYMRMVFCPVRCKGEEHFEQGKEYIVVCNHNSFVDVPVTSPWIPGPNKTLAKIEMARIPIFGKIYKTGSILVDRKSETSRKRSFTAMRQTLNMGIHICLYPEGTRNKTNKPLQAFREGAFNLAIREQKPIIPALIFNTGKILPHDKSFWAWPYAIDFHFLPAVSPGDFTTQESYLLKDQVKTIMQDYYVAHLTP